MNVETLDLLVVQVEHGLDLALADEAGAAIGVDGVGVGQFQSAEAVGGVGGGTRTEQTRIVVAHSPVGNIGEAERGVSKRPSEGSLSPAQPRASALGWTWSRRPLIRFARLVV